MKATANASLKEYMESQTNDKISMFGFPFFNEVSKRQNILLAGCGGGFDVFSALPFYFALKKIGKNVHFANLTFTQLPVQDDLVDPSSYITDITLRVDSTLDKNLKPKKYLPGYFPEYFLSQWFSSQGEDVPIYTFAKHTGVKQLTEAYQKLVELLNVDCIVLVDGGTDSLMTGDETSLGSPEEDSTSIAAVHYVKGENIYKSLTCIGFGIDSYHGVRHGQYLRNVARLITEGGFLGTFSLMKEMEEFTLFKQASEFVFQKMPDNKSIVVSHTVAAIDGKFGDYHPTASRTSGSKLFINPLMGLIWCFELTPIAKNLLYLDLIKDTTARNQIYLAIIKFRKDVDIITDYTNLPH